MSDSVAELQQIADRVVAMAKPGEHIAGFIYFGSPGRELEERPRPDPSEIVRKWDPPSD